VSKIAIVTDTNAGLDPKEAEKLGVKVIPMPFMVNGETHYEGIDFGPQEFYKALEENANVSTSQPKPADVLDTWDALLKDYESVIHIPMSSGLSGACATATMLAADYDGRVQVVDNHRISVTMIACIRDAAKMIEDGMSAEEIKARLLKEGPESQIYIMLDTLKYLKKGGRITPTAAAIGTILGLKPVLQIQGEKLDAFSKARNTKAGKKVMLDALHKNIDEWYGNTGIASPVHIEVSYSGIDMDPVNRWIEEVKESFPGEEITVAPLSLSVACHIGPGALAIAHSKRIETPCALS
jgi:DegV family protein with EDD domain